MFLKLAVLFGAFAFPTFLAFARSQDVLQFLVGFLYAVVVGSANAVVDVYIDRVIAFVF